MPVEDSVVESASEDEQMEIEEAPMVKRLRTEAKRKVNILISEIQSHIADRGSRGGLGVLRRNLSEALETVFTLNERYIVIKGLVDKQKRTAEQYYSSVERDARNCFSEIDEYLASRAGEPPSSVASHSFRSVSSSKTSSAKFREAQLRQAEAELRLRQVRRDAELELESSRRLRAKEVEIEEERRRLDLDKRRREQENEVERCQLETEALRQELEDSNSRSPSPVDGGLCESNVPANPMVNTRTIVANSELPSTEEVPVVKGSGLDQVLATSVKSPVSLSASGSSRVVDPDDWITKISLEISGSADSRPAGGSGFIGHLSRLEIKQFNGDPREWPMFSASFKSLVHDALPNDAQRLAYLRELLVPSVRNGIAQCLQSPLLYAEALRELRQRYGHPHLVSKAYIRSLLEIPPLKGRDFSALQEFYSDLHGAVSTLKHCGYEQDLMSAAVLEQILDKLPQFYRSKWGQEVLRILPQSPTLVDFDSWLDKLVMAEAFGQPLSGQAVKISKTVDHKRPQGKRDRVPTVLATTAESTTSSKKECLACAGMHPLGSCKRYLGLSLQDRAVLVKHRKGCFRCLNLGHFGKTCKMRKECGVDGCKGKHHSSLHNAPRVFSQKPESFTTVPETREEVTDAGHVGVTVNRRKPKTVLLSVVPVSLKANGKTVDTFALLDSGSKISLIREDVAEKLALSGPERTIRFGTFHGKDPVFRSKEVSLQISSIDKTSLFDVMDACTVPQINLSHRRINWPVEKKRWRHLSTLDIPVTDSSQVSLLIGMDVPDAHSYLDVRSPAPGDAGPRAVLTPFGWCATGLLDAGEKWDERVSINLLRTENQEMELSEIVEKFWRTDSLGVVAAKNPRSQEDQRAMQILENTSVRIGDRYEVGLMWRSDDVVLPDNRPFALRRMFALERRLLKDPEMARRYSEVINEYIRLNHARKLTQEEIEGPPGKTWYLPHHAVVNPNRPSKLRVVFDASARCSGTSLNSQLLQGPDLLTGLVGVLLRFRKGLIPVSADIEKMYHQVRVKVTDQPALRFLWREPGNTDGPKTFQMQVHVFGAVSSPTTCIYALMKTADDNKMEFPDVAPKVVENFYVDNYLDSVDSKAEAVVMSKRLTELLRRGGFRLTKWISSSRSVLQSISPSELVDSTLNLDLDDLPIERTLGILWDCERDSFCFKIQASDVSSKREVLRHISSIFDPLGLLAPVVFVAKVLFQDIWRSGCDWDERLPAGILNRWLNWTSGLHAVEGLRIPRCLHESLGPLSVQLHVFTDASQLGFGSVAYIRSSYSDGRCDVRFVMGKTRVAPLQQLTIPRLELQGAVVGVRLATTCCLELRMPLSQTVFWTDSQTVLQWIQSRTCRFHTFVGNRVGEILESTRSNQWRHVPGHLNPADDCTRGLQPEDLLPAHRWFRGPEFLRCSENDWPSPLPIQEPEADDPEVSPRTWTGTVTAPQPSPISLLASRTSSLLKFKRVIAYVLRFVNRAQKKQVPSEKWLLASELTNAFSIALRLIQFECFSSELDALANKRPVAKGSRLIKLSPFVAGDGVLRAGGRLENSDFSPDVKNPILLPDKHRLTDLVIEDVHRRCCHSSVDRTLHEIRRTFWVIKARASIRKVIHRCFTCKRRLAQPEIPLMAPLPAHRLKSLEPPFSRTGIDYFGPLHVVVRRSTEKRWGCLFTCLTTRAVHLELCPRLDADSFLMCFRRFIARRGSPAVCYSDNGTNFVAGERELSECVKNWNRSKIADSMAAHSIEWHFSPPAAPHFGGVWERLVRSAKTALKIVLKDRSVNDEVLSTVVTEVESLLNGRPLTHVSVDARDPEPITPNHFLLGRANPNIPPDVFESSEAVSRRRWRAGQAIVDHFWNRWMREYAPYLIERKKWLRTSRNIKEGDIVLIVDPTSPRGHWPLGRVLKPLPGRDGVVRAALVKTAAGQYVRPTCKLCLLEADEDVSG